VRCLTRFSFGVALLAVGSILNPVVSQTTLYKWVDEKGVTHYSESPPPQTRSRALKLETAPVISGGKTGSKPGKTLQQQEQEFRERQKEREAAAATDREKMQTADRAKSDRTQRCAEAKARIERLQAQRRAQLVRDQHRAFANEKADHAFDQRGIELNRLGKYVDENCPPN